MRVQWSFADRLWGRLLICWVILLMGAVLSPRDACAELVEGTFLLSFVEGYDFSEGRVTYGPVPDDSLEAYDLLQYVADFFDQPPPGGGVGFFAPNGIVDLGAVAMSEVSVAPEGIYGHDAGIVVDHTYCLVTLEAYYVKFHIYYDPAGEVDEKYKLDYLLQLDGSRNLDHMMGSSGCRWGSIKSLFGKR